MRLHLRPIFLCAALGASLFAAGCATSPTTSESSKKKAATLPPAPASEPFTADAVRLQILLDEANFGPGTIDGRDGEFTIKALERYAIANGLPADTRASDLNLARIDPFTTYTITEADVKRTGTVAATPEEQAKQKSMPYKNAAELVSERYHTSVAFLEKLNPDANVLAAGAGTSLRVPNVKPFVIGDVPETAKIPKKSALAGRRIKVDTTIRMLDVLEGDKLIASFPITPGSSTLPAPKGDWRIVGIATMPWFRYDEGVLERGERTDKFFMIPAGPNNPVGVLWMGLSKPGIGIHGTNTPITIGRAGSHGCIRMANWDAARMPSLVTTGASVRID